EAGKEWDRQETSKRKKEWQGKPKGKRIEWESLDLGKTKKGEVGCGWACDWELFASVSGKNEVAGSDSEPFGNDKNIRERNDDTGNATKRADSIQPTHPPSRTTLRHLSSSFARQLFSSASKAAPQHHPS